MVRKQGNPNRGRGGKFGHSRNDGANGKSAYATAIDDAGIARRTADRWQQLAEIPRSTATQCEKQIVA